MGLQLIQAIQNILFQPKANYIENNCVGYFKVNLKQKFFRHTLSTAKPVEGTGWVFIFIGFLADQTKENAILPHSLFLS
jgi:hypothetical protein